MAIFIAVIRIVFFSLAMAQQELASNLDDSLYLYVVEEPVHNTTQCPTPRCMLWSQTLSKRDDYTYTPGIGGHKLHTRAAVWNEARLTCEEEGGHLAIINSIAEANVLTELFRNSDVITGSDWPREVIVGIHDYFDEGNFVTIYGQSLARAGYNQWRKGDPSGHPLENCGSMDQSGRLNDIDCGIRFGFICEIPMY